MIPKGVIWYLTDQNSMTHCSRLNFKHEIIFAAPYSGLDILVARRNDARTYLQTQLPLPEFFPIGQWNRFKLREVRHLTDPLALKLVRNGTKYP